jgi:hypothetical protein
MEQQNQIKRTLSNSDSISHIQRLIQDGGFVNRTRLADAICEQLDLRDPGGQLQRGGCLKALRELEAEGNFVLPASRVTPGERAPRRLGDPVPEPTGVPEEVGELRGLELVPVKEEREVRIWNELMLREHPRGAGRLVGRLLRYLIASEHGWLGGLGFAAPALQLAARDKWIGWSVEERRAGLHYVLGLSRLLIRPGVRCRNLASWVLGWCAQVVPEDFERRYNIRPLLLESFVDTEVHLGTCYRAANWIRVGQTSGRGRQDRLREASETVKDIYVYPLEKDFRVGLGLAADAGAAVLKVSDGLDSAAWADKEFGGADLGDARLNQRLVEIARMKGEQPGSGFADACGGDWAATKGYYRLIDHPDEEAVNMEAILAPHRERTIRRMQGQRVVLCIQDGSTLDFSGLAQCEGLGVIGSNQTGAQTRGLQLHSTLAVTTQGLPIGVLRAQCDAPVLRSPEETRYSYQIPIEEKETFCWIQGLRDLMNLAADMPQTRLVDVSDRESDIFELFEEWQGNSCVDLLVRAKNNRVLESESVKLFEAVAQSPLQGEIKVEIGRQSARPKRSKREARPKKEARTAILSLRYRQVKLAPPSYARHKEAIEIWVIHALEESPPAGVEAIEWFLLTTLSLECWEDAARCLSWYCLRWRIEDWHRVLKSGCRIEEAAHKTAERLTRSIAINLVIAWRIMLMTRLGREVPQLPAEVLFSDLEIKVLSAYAKKKRPKAPMLLGALMLLGDAVRLTARIGGYLGRANDPPPGDELMWNGYTQLQLLCEGFALRDDDTG